jgi:hypothetical protein
MHFYSRFKLTALGKSGPACNQSQVFGSSILKSKNIKFLKISLEDAVAEPLIFFMVPVQTFDKFRLRFRIYIIKSRLQNFLGKNLAFLHRKLFYKEKIYKFYQIH